MENPTNDKDIKLQRQEYNRQYKIKNKDKLNARARELYKDPERRLKKFQYRLTKGQKKKEYNGYKNEGKNNTDVSGCENRLDISTSVLQENKTIIPDDYPEIIDVVN